MTSIFEEREKKLASTYKVGIYCRLSKADGDGESASIANQRAMLIAHCQQKGWEVVKVYEDDGFSGLKANRPKLQELLSDVESGRINLVITKDYSRLGRDRLHTDELREKFFPTHGCRYVSVLDGYDSLYSGSSAVEEIMPFKSVLNEMYSRDISKKVHATYKSHAEQGLYTGTVPPLGYLKDPNEKGHLIIDPETAPIIRKIFSLALDGRGPNYICRRLEEEKIPCPTYWNRTRGFRSTVTKWEVKDPENGKYVWDFSAVKSILENPIYIGTVASQKVDYRFKLGVLSDKPASEWIMVPNCHESLINEDDFQAVQDTLRTRKRPRQDGSYSLFAGLLRCGECGKSLNLKYSNSVSKKPLYACKTYSSYGKHHCTQHRIDHDVLCEIILQDIRAMVQEVFADENGTAEEIATRFRSAQQKQLDGIKRQILASKSRMEALDAKMLKLYDDNISGRLSDDMLGRLTEKVQQEHIQLSTDVELLEKKLQHTADSGEQAAEWLKVIQEYKSIDTLTPELLHRLINYIVVHETITDGKSSISLEIHYRIKPEVVVKTT